MKPYLLISFAGHLLLLVLFFVIRPSPPRWEGYPVVIPVEIIKLKPVSYKAPEVETAEPHVSPPKIETRPLEGVTLKKTKIKKTESKSQEVKQKIKSEKSLKETKGVKSTVKSKNIELDVAEFPFSYYLALIRSRIQNNWEPPFRVNRIVARLKTVVYFKIQRGGQISNVMLEKSSGNRLFDQAALRAVMLANPLPPLPFDFPQPELGVHFEFEQGI